MPKRSDRTFYSDIFESNPFEDFDPEEMYKSLRWGNNPNEIFDIRAPEPLVTIGDLAQLKLSDQNLKWDESEAPFLAVGKDSNCLYIIPKDESGYPIQVPKSGYFEVDSVRQTDYYSDKGGEDAYYFHKHENPFPKLLVHQNGIAVIIPSEHKKKRSYAVGKDGIVG